MDIVSTLTNTLKKLKAKRDALGTKINTDKECATCIMQQIKDCKVNFEKINKEIEKSEHELDNLNNTIEQTENGYNKILEAGETLMSIVSQNLTDVENINVNPHNQN